MLLYLSKIFERCMYYQLKDYFEKILSKYQCGFSPNKAVLFEGSFFLGGGVNLIQLLNNCCQLYVIVKQSI